MASMLRFTRAVGASLSLVAFFTTLCGHASTTAAPTQDYADSRLADVDPRDDGFGNEPRRRRPPSNPRPASGASEPEAVDLRDESAKYRHRNVSFTISPLHLLSPILELTLEIRLAGKKRPVALALIGGYGKGNGRATSESQTIDVKATAYEVGGQLLWYPLSCFESLQRGAEALYLNADLELTADQVATGSGTGLAVGPLIGYKLISSAGFTFLAQPGLAYVTAKAEATNQTTGASGSGSGSDWKPLLNLNLGWSF